MNSLNVLNKALVLIKSGYTKDAVAKGAKNRIVDACGTYEKIYDKDGKVIDTKFHEAASWSITGAILRAEGSNHFFQTDAYKYVTKVANLKGFRYFSDMEDQSGMGKNFSNKTTLQDALNMIQEAIKLIPEGRT